MKVEQHGATIQIVGCAKTFADGTNALQATDLTIEAGSTFVLLGPSGCGKTTTLRIIAGLESPDLGGRVLFDGADVTALPIERRNVGMVFQSYALFPNMNVAENVAYGLRVRGVDKQQRLARAAEVMELVRIEELAGRAIDQLSGGQRQRVALARALAVRPRALLLDEPLTALDATLREHLRSEIDALLRSLKITAVYVTHDQAEAMTLGDRIVVMDRGRIAQIGTPQEIYFQPASRFVAEFIGTTNRLHGAVRNGLLETAAGSIKVSERDRAGVIAMFRPEAARMAGASEAPLRFTVDRVHFLGDRQRLFLVAGDGPPVVVEADNKRSVAPGSSIGLFIEAADLTLV